MLAVKLLTVADWEGKAALTWNQWSEKLPSTHTRKDDDDDDEIPQQRRR